MILSKALWSGFLLSLAIRLPGTLKQYIRFPVSAASRHRKWASHWHRRLSSSRRSTKSVVTLALIGFVASGDFITGEELSFSLFYLLPITYAAWFYDSKAGVVAALVCAIAWLGVEVVQHPVYSREWIPAWNAFVRFGFFVLGVGLVRQIKRTEIRLLREVHRRTRTLREESRRRRELQVQLMEVIAHEHTQIAQDLHDGLGQYLSALAFHARVLSDELGKVGSPYQRQAEKMVAIVRALNQSIREIGRAMRIPEAESGGFMAAMRASVAEFRQLTGIECEVSFTAVPLALDHFQAMMLFRIMQEALNNAVKHGHPRSIRVVVAADDGWLRASVSNDGHPFPEKTILPSGLGLQTMQLRAELIGGKLALESDASGFTVTCVLPLKNCAEAKTVLSSEHR